ncbi:MAG: TonB-dependent receptor [Gemmatimonadetes bacterium]|nr:TonB-dependent receptor [Gemmatimonadota bacterium]
MLNRASIFALSLLLVPAVASGQVARDTAHVAAVVVTATRSPLLTGRAPASVSVIGGDDLRREGVTTVLEALRRVPGLSIVQTGANGGVTSLFIRGGESKFAKVLVDGVPVNDAGGAFDFASLSTDNLDRIEVVRGPASVLYGSDAMAGVVQLFTRSGDGRPKGEISARGGAEASYDADASVRGSNGAFNYSLAGARHSTDGIQAFNSQYRQSVGSALLGFGKGAADAHLSMRYSDNNFHYPTDGAGQVADSNAVRRDDRLALGLDAGYRLSHAAELRLSLASHDVHGITDDQPDSKGDVGGYYYTTGDRTRRRSADLRMNLELPSNTRLTIGGQVENEWQASETQSSFGPNAFTAHRHNTGAYGQLLLAPADAYTITVGGRYENNETFGNFFTYRAAGSIQATDLTRFHASIGTAFREPTFLENYGSAFVIGNGNLAPEHALSFDAGVDQKIGDRFTVGATLFSNSFRDLIDYRYSATAPNYNNIARTKTSGLEVEGKLVLPNNLYADASFTYLDAKVVDPGTSAAVTATFAPGSRLLRRPMHTVDVGIGYRESIVGVDLRAHSVGLREDNFYPPDFAATQRVNLPAYTKVDLSGDVRLFEDASRNVKLTVRADNLFDKKYSEVAGVNYGFAQSDEASVSRTGYRAAGRKVLTGLVLTF